MDDVWPKLPGLDEYAKKKVNQQIFKPANLNRVNKRRIKDLEKYNRWYEKDAVEQFDNAMYDFLNNDGKKIGKAQAR